MAREKMAREKMEFDVVIVGGGPAGLAAAIRLRQCAVRAGRSLAVCLLEKGASIGAHIISGAVIDPSGLSELLPDWQKRGAPVRTRVEREEFCILSENRHYRIPGLMLPPTMRNHGNYICSLGELCAWLGREAEAIGVDVFPAFAAADILRDGTGAVAGVITGDMGRDRAGREKANFQQGVEIHASYTLFAEGCRGSLSRRLVSLFGLDRGKQPQKYGIGFRELWELDPGQHRRGLVFHSVGWPLPAGVGGGAFVYHMEDNRAAVGLVVHLDYANPYLSPYDLFQRLKHHPVLASMLAGGRRVGYGARAISEGGLMSLPELVFPGGALAGCAAGLVNFPKIKGSHNAIRSGIMAAEAIFGAINSGRSRDRLDSYTRAFRASPVRKELWRARNVKPGLKWGLAAGLIHGGLQVWLNDLGLGWLFPVDLKHAGGDHESLKPARTFRPAPPLKPDNVLSFDRMSSVFLAGISHDEDQPGHLLLGDPEIPVRHNLQLFDAPEQRYCPAGVYEIVTDGDGPRLLVNAQNCIHCKTCDIKDPLQNITWTVPEGGSGPNYPGM